LYAVLKVEKLHNSFTFMLIAFFVETFFYNFFNGFDPFFDTHIEIIREKNLEVILALILTLKPNAHKKASKNKNSFFQT
jgi:hypothetical protein